MILHRKDFRMPNLTNKTLIITGSSRGIGRALAVDLARQGVDLILNARSKHSLDQVCLECSEHKGRVQAVAGDISRAETVAECVAQAEAMENMFGFIHVAGVLHPGPFVWELDEESFDQVMGSSVKASYLLIRHAVPALLARERGLAVFVGSGAAEITQPGIGAYCAAKSAEERLARQLAAETDKVTSCVFRPGIVDTQMQEQARQAQGGGAEQVQLVFRSWKERGELITPEQSANDLIQLLKKDHSTLHGKTFRAGE